MMAPLFSILIQTNSKNRTQIHLKPENFLLNTIHNLLLVNSVVIVTGEECHIPHTEDARSIH
jgi:hypothetical protein